MRKAFIMLSLCLIMLSGCSELNDVTEKAVNQIDDDEKTEEQNSHKSQETDSDISGLEAHFIDVGQANATLVSYNDHNILIDTGDWTGDGVVPYLKDEGVETIDLLIGTHPHADHIGQMEDVIHVFDVNKVWMSGDETTSEIYKRVMTSIEQDSGIKYVEPEPGHTVNIGKASLETYAPINKTGDLNDDSIVTSLDYKGMTFLFTGDAEKNSEKDMINKYGDDLNADIINAGHHGSDTSSTPAFIDAVSPDVAVISAGTNNEYGHPNQSVLDTYRNHDTDIYGTMTHGNIIITTNGDNYHIETEKEGTVEAGY